MQEVIEYELIYILDLEKFKDIDSIKTTVQKIIEENGGQVKKTSEPQKRKLAYPIGSTRSGIYLINRILLEKDKVKSVAEKLRHEKDILRSMLVLASKLPKAQKKTEKEPAIAKEKEKERIVKTPTEKEPVKEEKQEKEVPEEQEKKKEAAPKKEKKEKLKFEELDKKIEDILKDDLI